MRYTVPAGRNEAPYALWHEKSIQARSWYLALGMMYPVIICIALGLHGGVGTFMSAIFYAVLLFGVSRFQAYKTVRSAPEEFARKAIPETSPQYRQALLMIEELCQRAGVDWRPQLIVFESEGFDGFASHPPGRDPYIILSTGAFLYGKRSVRAVIAHELSHMLHGDMTLVERATILHMVTMAMLALILSVPMAMAGGESADSVFFLVFLLGFTFIYLRGLKIALNTHSRYREYLADGGAAALIGWENRMDMAVALHWTFVAFKELLKKKVRQGQLYKDFRHPQTGAPPREGWLEDMQQKALDAIDEMEETSSIMNTHPTNKERYAALDITEDELKQALEDHAL